MGMHAGISVGPDGATHQMLEDLGMMRMLPNMTVLNPADAEEGRKMIVAAAKTKEPTYVRFGRMDVPVFTTPETPFGIGKALMLWKSEKPKVTLVASGSMSYNALMAARSLDADGIGSIVLHLGSASPLDVQAIVDAAKQTGRVVSIEEHQIKGGVGSAVAEALAANYPVPMKFIGLDSFGQSGTPTELIEHYGLHPAGIAESVRTFVC